MKIRFKFTIQKMILFLFTVAFISNINTVIASACTCVSPFPSPQDSLEKSIAVFSGKVTNIDIPNGININSANPVLVIFNVSEIWKGPNYKTLVLRTEMDEAGCGYPFKLGEEYIVYAYGEEKRLITNICWRTELIANAREDLKALGKGNLPNISGSNINVDFARATAKKTFNALDSRYVWAEDAGMNLAFNLTPLNFDGFYYDLDNNAGSESISIRIDNITEREIKENECIYSATVVNVPFKYRPFGNYSIIGFMGDRYFAGYTSGSRIARFPVTLVNHSLFGIILIDENKAQILTNESILTLNEKYVLKIRVLNSTEGTVQVILEKFGGEMDRRVIKIGDTYVFEKDIREIISDYSYTYNKPVTVGKIPIIAVHIDSVFAGEDGETGVVIEGIFQLSDVYTSVDPGFGLMKITNISETGIIMTNAVPLTLTQMVTTSVINGNLYQFNPGGYYDMMGDIKLKVADSEALRFSLYKESIETRNLEHRGAVYTESTPVTAWDGRNFSGFWYDIDSDSSSELLEITGLTERIIPAGGLKYTTNAVDIHLISPKITGVKPKQFNGSYKAFGLGTNKYAVINETKNLKLANILVNQRDKKSLMNGETWEMGEDYSLNARSVDIQSREVCFILRKNRVLLDDKCLLQGSIYSYPTIISSSESDPPLFITYLDAIFTGDVDDVIFLKYTWLRSNNVTEIHEGDRLGVFNITKLGNDSIEMKNDRAINLIPGSRINLIGDLGFVVANSNNLRFYPSDRISADVAPETTTELTTEMGYISDTPLVPVNSRMKPSDKNNATSSLPFVAAAMILILVAFFDRYYDKGKKEVRN